MKRFLFASVMMVIGVVTSWAYDVEIDGFFYNLNGNTKQATVTSELEGEPYYKTKPTGDITIPEAITYEGVTYSVTRIDNWAFDCCLDLTSVTIPNSVTSIGCYSFGHCSGMTSVIIPNSVTSIGMAAFYGCSSLVSVTISNSITSIGFNVFFSCISLTSVTIPNSVTSIGNGAFSECI